jgi:hypothetical protein
VKIPLKRGSAQLTALPLDELMGAEEDAMDVDGDEEEPGSSRIQGVGLEVQDYGIEVDFEELDEELREVSTCSLSLPSSLFRGPRLSDTLPPYLSLTFPAGPNSCTRNYFARNHQLPQLRPRQNGPQYACH